MKTCNKLFYILMLAFICCFASKVTASQKTSPIKHLNFSLWSEYKREHFDGLTQDQKTEKLQNIFKDKLNFVQEHQIRRLIVKILNPNEFAFFHPANFDPDKEDNFYFWACQLVNHVRIEALFDCSQFKCTSLSLFDHLIDCYSLLRNYFGEQEKPFGNFQNIIDKMEWVSWTNEIYNAKARNYPLIAGIALDPKGIGTSLTNYQNLVNAFDQFRFEPHQDCCVPEWIPENSYSTIEISMLLPLDMKDFALANAATFPLITEIRDHKDPTKLGILLPENFPSNYPNFEPPVWRHRVHKRPLLDTIYLNMGDFRLVSSIYQNYSVLPKPDQKNEESNIRVLCDNLQKVFHGTPFVKGPGYISNQSGSDSIKGSYTFFRTGSSDGEGQFTQEDLIEIRPPYTQQPISRLVVNQPESNKKMTISSPFSTTHSFDNSEYWHCPIPCNWSRPKISTHLKSKLYFVFNTRYDPNKDKYFGNWEFHNFLYFMEYFLTRALFSDLNGQLVVPNNNLVLYDFSSLPNGKPFPEVNWELGNQNY